MSALKKGSQASRACDLLTELQKQSIQLGVQSYNIVISAFADEARWPQALQLALSLSFRHEALDDFARTKLLAMQRLPWRLGLTFVADGGAEAFRSALQMVGATQWTLTLDAFAQNLRSRRLEPSLGQLATLPWRTSMEELQKIPVLPGPPRDLLALLRSAAQQSAPAAALALAALPRAVAAYGAVLGRCAEEKNWTLALALLETMQVENVQKDCLCFSSMMDATSTRAEWLRALAIFEGLKESLKDSKDLDLLDLDLLGSVSIQSCSSHWPCSLQLLRSLRRSMLRPQLLSYTSLSTLLGDVGDDWRQALQVLQHAQEQRVTPNNSLLSSVAATLRVGTWRHQRAPEDGHHSTGGDLHQLLQRLHWCLCCPCLAAGIATAADFGLAPSGLGSLDKSKPPARRPLVGGSDSHAAGYCDHERRSFSCLSGCPVAPLIGGASSSSSLWAPV